MKLVVGLGNPGERYALHRHNAGFSVIDHLAGAHGIAMGMRRFRSLTGRGMIADTPVTLVKPQTYMNLCGIAVAEALGFFKLDISDVVIIHDDLDLSFGDIRVKVGGGDGGHKGVKSVIDHIGGSEFVRVRLGIGKPADKDMVERYVLSEFSESERKMMPGIVERASQAASEIVLSGAEAAMNKYNARHTIT